MHNSHIPDSVKEAAARMRAPASSAPLDPKRTAHVVVDLQNGFVEEGAPVEVPMNREIAPNVNKISQALRGAGGLNVYIRFTVDPNEDQDWSVMWNNVLPEAKTMMADTFEAGSHNHAVWSGLDVQPEDAIVDKTRFSAFIPGTCDLHEILQEKGIDTLIVTGCVTNCCCESTTRDAMQMGYRVLFVEDGNAAFSDEDHNATLANMHRLFFAEVCTADSVVARLPSAASQAA